MRLMMFIINVVYRVVYVVACHAQYFYVGRRRIRASAVLLLLHFGCPSRPPDGVTGKGLGQCLQRNFEGDALPVWSVRKGKSGIFKLQVIPETPDLAGQPISFAVEAFNECSSNSMSAYPDRVIYGGKINSVLADCTVLWKSLSVIRVHTGIPRDDARSEVESKIFAFPLYDLQQFCKTESMVGLSEDEKSQRYSICLKLASISIHDFLVKRENNEVHDLKITQTDKSVVFKSVIQAWAEDSDILFIINAVFNDPKETLAEQKKLALDLGFVLASHLLNFADPSFGFTAPISKWQQLLLLITAKLLESFMVTTPPHFPFMPAQYFSTIRWPVVVRESCSGKVHSIVSFAPVIDEGCGTGEGSPERKDDMKYCNYEVVNRRQPWKNRFSVLQLYQLALVVMESKTISVTMRQQDEYPAKVTDTTCTTVEECDELLTVLRNVLQRIAAVDPALLYRDKAKSVVYKEAATCNLCDHAVSSLLGRLNPFSLFGTSPGGSNNNHNTRDCAASVASTDTASSAGSHLFGFMKSSKTANPGTVVKVTAGTAESVPVTRNNKSNNLNTTSAGMGTGPLAKHHCRLCLEVICPACCAPELWMNDRVCAACYSVVQEMGLRDLKPRKKHKQGQFSSAGTSEAETAGGAATSLTPQEQLVLSILRGEPAGTMLGEPVYSDEELTLDDESDDGRITPCCSELMPASLRVWRDGQDDAF